MAPCRYKNKTERSSDGNDIRRVVASAPPGHQRRVDREAVLRARPSRRSMSVVPADPTHALERTAGRSLARSERSMIRSLYILAFEARWNRDRRRRIAKMREKERTAVSARIDWVEAMAIQLAEIRMLPEMTTRRRTVGSGQSSAVTSKETRTADRPSSSAGNLEPIAKGTHMSQVRNTPDAGLSDVE
jgi:hypothetical protein